MAKDRKTLLQDLTRLCREHTAPEDRAATEALIAELPDIPVEVEIPARPTKAQWKCMKVVHAFTASGIGALRKDLIEKLEATDGAMASLLRAMQKKGLIKHVECKSDEARSKKEYRWLLTKDGEYWIGKAEELDALLGTKNFHSGLPFPEVQSPLRLRGAREVMMTFYPGGVERSVRVVGDFDQQEGPNNLRILRPKQGGIRIETRDPIGLTLDVLPAPEVGLAEDPDQDLEPDGLGPGLSL